MRGKLPSEGLFPGVKLGLTPANRRKRGLSPQPWRCQGRFWACASLRTGARPSEEFAARLYAAEATKLREMEQRSTAPGTNASLPG